METYIFSNWVPGKIHQFILNANLMKTFFNQKLFEEGEESDDVYIIKQGQYVI